MRLSSTTLLRWLKFNAVGAAGIAVQLAALAFLKSGIGLNYLFATTIAVECAVLHNFVWHERFTWADRKAHARLERLAKFNLSNGAVSIIGNLALMKLLAGSLGLNYFLANILSITVCSLLNFVVSDTFVFTQSVDGKECP
jgi:putative flippase GtrA